MSSSFFISKKLKKKIEKDIAKRSKIEDNIKQLQESLDNTEDDIEDDMTNFYQEIDKITVVSILEFAEQNPSTKEAAKQIKNNFTNNCLAIEETLTLLDWYEMMMKNCNSNF